MGLLSESVGFGNLRRWVEGFSRNLCSLQAFDAFSDSLSLTVAVDLCNHPVLYLSTVDHSINHLFFHSSYCRPSFVSSYSSCISWLQQVLVYDSRWQGHIWSVCGHCKSGFPVHICWRTLSFFESLAHPHVLDSDHFDFPVCVWLCLITSFFICCVSSPSRNRWRKLCPPHGKISHHLQVRVQGYSTRYFDSNDAKLRAGLTTPAVLLPSVVFPFILVS